MRRAAYAFFVVMLGTTLPTPLYPLYERRLGFSSLLVTVIFAVYAVGVIAGLIGLGGLSDRLGRRPVLLAGIARSAASALLFVLANALVPILAGRVLSGLSAGIFTGSATVAVIELAPAHRRTYASGVATAANLGGLGAGTLLSGALAAWAFAPLRLPYWVQLAALVPAAVGVLRMPETVGARRGGFRIRPLGVPAQLRATFVRAAVAGFAGFAMSGLFSAVGPSFTATELGHRSPALAGFSVFCILASSAAGQLVIGRIPAGARLASGCAGIVAGALCVAGAVEARSLALLIAGALIAGSGQGIAVSAGIAELNAGAPRERRGEVASSFFVACYLALSIPIVGVGLLVQATGLRPAALAFSAAVALLGAGALASLLRRP